MDSVDRLLKYDPIAEAEKISGKGHWSNFSEQDNMLALLLNMQHAGNKEEVLKGNKDTYFSMSWDYLMEVLFENGFKVGTEWEFIDNQYNQIHKEKAGIYYREDGVVVFAESHSDCKSVNSGKCFYELEMKEELGVIDIESSLTTMGTSSFMTLIDESTFEPPKEDISSLKKRIKHCKNHMEKQKLQRELNALYKEQKRKGDYDKREVEIRI